MPSDIDIVRHALSPQIVIFSDENVDRSCRLNGCKSLDQLFKPWQSSIERVSILSSLLSSTTHPFYAVRFTSHAALLQSHFGGGGTVPYSPDIVVDIVSNLVRATTPEQNLQYEILRSVLLASSPISAQDTFNFPVCYIFATSSSTPDPLKSLADLSLAAQQSPILSNNPSIDNLTKTVQQFYLLVHDVATEGPDLARAQQLLRQITQRYGPHCSLLVINSRMRNTSPPTPGSSGLKAAPESSAPYHDKYMTSLASLTGVDPFTRLTEVLAEDVQVRKLDGHLIASRGDAQLPQYAYAQYLDEKDAQSIQDCIRGITVQSVIPWMEARVREWNEIHLRSRKGVAAKLFGAGRRLFGSGSLTLATTPKLHPANEILCPDEHFSSSSKRLADFAFMLRDYNLAASIYEGIQAYYPAELESGQSANLTLLRAISNLLTLQGRVATSKVSPAEQFRRTELRSKVIGPLSELARSTPKHFFIRFDLLRKFVLFCEAWQMGQVEGESEGYGVVCSILVNVAGKVEDVFRAVLMERAATMELATSRIRKSGLYFALADTEYAQCGHKPFSKYSLVQAMATYRSRPAAWRYVKAYMHYNLAQQTYMSGEAELALKSFTSLLVPGAGSAYQAGFLQDASLAWQRLSTPSGLEPVVSDNFLAKRIFQDACLETHPVHATTAKIESESDRHLMPKLTLLACNSTNVILHLTEIRLSLLAEAEEFAGMRNTTRDIPDLTLLPSKTNKVSLFIEKALTHGATPCSLTYCVEGSVRCVELLTLHSGQESQPETSLSCLHFDEGCNLDVSAQRAVSPRECEVVRSTKTRLLNGECVSVNLSLVNNSNLDLMDIHICSVSSACNITWLDAHEGQMASFCDWSPPDGVRSEILAKVLRPAEAKLFHGYFVIRPKEIKSIEAILEYTSQDELQGSRMKHFQPFVIEPSVISYVQAVTLRLGARHRLHEEASKSLLPSRAGIDVGHAAVIEEVSWPWDPPVYKGQSYRKHPAPGFGLFTTGSNNMGGRLQFDSISLADGSALPSIYSVPRTQPSRHDTSNLSETHVGMNTEEVDAHLPSTKTGHAVRPKDQHLPIFATSLNLPARDVDFAVRRVYIRSAIEFPDKKDPNASTRGVHRILIRSKKRLQAVVAIKPVMDVELVDDRCFSSGTAYPVELSQDDGRATCNDDLAKHAGEAFGFRTLPVRFIMTNQSEVLALEYTLRPHTRFVVNDLRQREAFLIGKISTKASCPPLSSSAVNFNMVVSALPPALPPAAQGDWMLEIAFR